MQKRCLAERWDVGRVLLFARQQLNIRALWSFLNVWGIFKFQKSRWKTAGPFFPTQNDKSSQHIEERIPVDVWAFSLPEPQHSTLVLQLGLNEAHADQRNAHISDEEWRLRLAGRVHFASLLPQVQYLCECVCTHVHWLLSVCILYKPGRIFWKCVPCGWWNEKAFFFRRAHQSPAFSPGLFSSAFFHVFFFFFFSCFYSVILVCLCYSKVLSAFYDIKCLCQRWQDWTDGLCSTENWFCGGLTFHQLHFTLLIHHWLPWHLSRPYWSDQDRKRPLSHLGEQSSGFNLFWIFIYLL